MFDNVGRDLDEEAAKRQAQSAFLTLVVLGSIGGAILLAGLYKAAEVVMDLPQDEELVELEVESAEDEAPPPPPPPPPPPADAGAEETEDTETQPDEMTEEVKELKEEVKEEVKNEVAPSGGQEGGVEGGVVGGQVGGVIGGVVGGVVGGTLGGTGGGYQTVHNSQVKKKSGAIPDYPDQAKELHLGEQSCKAKLRVDEKGEVEDVDVSGCLEVFHPNTKAALMGWKYFPQRVDGRAIKFQTTVMVQFKPIS